MLFVIFFKQKTAYDMRISDWSSDVCSSDLAVAAVEDVENAIEVPVLQFARQGGDAVDAVRLDATRAQRGQHVAAGVQRHLALGRGTAHQHSHAAERGRTVDARRRQRPAHRSPPSNPLAASCCAAWPM